MALQVVQRDGGGEHCVQDAFRNFAHRALTVGVQNGRAVHQVAHIAYKHQRATMQPHSLAPARRRGVETVRVQATGKAVAALAHLLGQAALQNAQPVAVGHHLVLRIHHGHRIFQVHDGGQCSFKHQIANAGRVGRADWRGAVDDDVQMQAMVRQQHRRRVLGIALVAHQLAAIGQAGLAAVGQFHQKLGVLDVVAH